MAKEGWCPRCSAVRLGERDHGGFALQHCSGCHGLWIERADFEALVSQAREGGARWLEPMASDAGASLALRENDSCRCPSCREQMRQVRAVPGSALIVDECRDCGWWLDGGELEVLAGVVRESEPMSGWDWAELAVHAVEPALGLVLLVAAFPKASAAFLVLILAGVQLHLEIDAREDERLAQLDDSSGEGPRERTRG